MCRRTTLFLWLFLATLIVVAQASGADGRIQAKGRQELEALNLDQVRKHCQDLGIPKCLRLRGKRELLFAIELSQQFPGETIPEMFYVPKIEEHMRIAKRMFRLIRTQVESDQADDRAGIVDLTQRKDRDGMLYSLFRTDPSGPTGYEALYKNELYLGRFAGYDPAEAVEDWERRCGQTARLKKFVRAERVRLALDLLRLELQVRGYSLKHIPTPDDARISEGCELSQGWVSAPAPLVTELMIKWLKYVKRVFVDEWQFHREGEGTQRQEL
ncbi:uncharacterized protein BJ171DRAFT_506962 [Polychytrium aggregatum]|uniref:uncharacterized protein n=1 Tax=Polychytrium aggregatum TaxID=110093 RepID=UPI0022FE6457|nr:uncharacterized protein BJ171DRAFT_506962 [Polychytrium aggregatum]KAI9204311.1 hypothetical protein BJ171DRAFT_506962 [Polychytrium aggregatum]